MVNTRYVRSGKPATSADEALQAEADLVKQIQETVKSSTGSSGSGSAPKRRVSWNKGAVC